MARNFFISWARLSQSTPTRPISWRYLFSRFSQFCENRLLASSCLSVCPSAWKNWAPTGWILSKFISEDFSKICRKNSSLLKSDKNNGYFTLRPVCRVIRKSLCTWRLQYKKHANIHYCKQFQSPTMTVLYWTRSLRTQLGVSINVWRLAGDTLNLLVTFCIVIIRWTEIFWSPCTFMVISLWIIFIMRSISDKNCREKTHFMLNVENMLEPGKNTDTHTHRICNA